MHESRKRKRHRTADPSEIQPINSIVEKVLLMTSLRDLMICKGAAVACAKRRDAHSFVRFMLEQILVPALNNCAKY